MFSVSFVIVIIIIAIVTIKITEKIRVFSSAKIDNKGRSLVRKSREPPPGPTAAPPVTEVSLLFLDPNSIFLRKRWWNLRHSNFCSHVHGYGQWPST